MKDFIFEDVGLWKFVAEDGGLGVFVDEDTGLECERKGEVWEEGGHIGQFQECSGRFCESLWRRDRNRRGVLRETLSILQGTLYRSVSPGDSTGADEAGVYRAWVGMNVTADEKKHKDKKQR